MRLLLIQYRRGEIFGILLTLGMLTILLVGLVRFPETSARYMAHIGQGADWDCQSVPRSESICVRPIPKKPGG